MVTPSANLSGAHHLGITVESLAEALAFWSRFLGKEPAIRRVASGPHLDDMIGLRGVELEIAVLELEGGLLLELVEYRSHPNTPHPDDTSIPGNVHLCLTTSDMERTRRRAIDAGARSVGGLPIVVPDGPNAGALASYLRTPSGVTLELIQPPPDRPDTTQGARS